MCNGTVGTVSYDPGNRATGIGDRLGRQVFRFNYDAVGNLESVCDAGERCVTYSYIEHRLSHVGDVLNNLTAYEYDGHGRLARKTSAEGYVTTISYNARWQVYEVTGNEGDVYRFYFARDDARQELYARVEYPLGLVKEVWYDSASQDTKVVAINGEATQEIQPDSLGYLVIDERGEPTLWSVDADDNVLGKSYPDGSGIAMEYDPAFSKKTKETDERGVVTRFTYDGAGNLIEKTEAAGTPEARLTRYTYDGAGNPLSAELVTGASAQTLWSKTYDDNGNMLSETDGAGNPTNYAYDAMGNPLTRTNPAGEQWQYQYDAAGHLLQTTDPLGKTTQLQYDGEGNVVKSVDAEGRSTLFSYNGHHRLLQKTDPLGQTTNYTYDLEDHLTRITDPAGKSVYYAYDNRGRRIKSVDGNGNTTSSEYVGISGCSACSGTGELPARTVSPTGSVTEFVYDRRNRLIETDTIPDPAGAPQQKLTATSAYDPAGNLLTTTDREGQATSHTYDSLGRLTKTTDALGNATMYTYDARNNLVALKDGNGNTTRFDYDVDNRQLKETHPSGQTISSGYDTAGRLAQKTDSKGQRTEYGYDAADRVTAIRYRDASNVLQKTVTFAYDAVGNLLSYDDGTTSATYTYDEANRKTGETVDYGPFSLSQAYTYFANGRKSSYTGPDNITYSYAYDANNQLSKVTIPGVGEIGVSRYDWTRPSQITLPGGTVTNLGYDPLMNLESLGVKATTGETALNYGYTHDQENNVLSKSSEQGEYRYTYDSLYRLTQASTPTGPEENYTYDPVGNRLSSTEFSDWSYGDGNELISYDGVSYTHDANGNTVTKTVGGNTTNYRYDLENRLSGITSSVNSTSITYSYDPFGRRLSKNIGGVTTYLVYSDEGLVGEYDGNGKEIKTYGFKPGSTWSTDPLFVNEDTDANGVAEYYFYLNDHLGTPQKLVDINGEVVWSAVYDDFGQASVEVETVGNNLRFPGQYYDQETGLQYNLNRYYDPASGRYLTPDPIGLRGGFNLYTYAKANPINLSDPEGLCVEDACIGESIIVTAIIYFGAKAAKETYDLLNDHKNSCDRNCDCEIIYTKIDGRVKELQKRYYDLIIDKFKLPQSGPMSIDGHRQQFRNKQVNLRNLLNEALSQGCTGFRPDAWFWATIDAP